MIEVTIEDLKQLLSDGRRAAQYAWDHYEELVSREAIYTLYGPYSDNAGAVIPWGYPPKRVRDLKLKTRRQKYLLYELDSKYKPIRVQEVFNHMRDDTYHFFELDGVQYGCPFVSGRKEMSISSVIAVSYKDGKPYYYASLHKNGLYVRFCEYVSQGNALMTEYGYNPLSKYTFHGYLTDPNAPIGELNSAAYRVCWEEEPVYTDFSQWFKKTEDSPMA